MCLNGIYRIQNFTQKKTREAFRKIQVNVRVKYEMWEKKRVGEMKEDT